MLLDQRGITKEQLIEEAKKYIGSWAATDSNFKDIDAEEFTKSINLTDEEVVRIFTDVEYMSNQKVPEKLQWITFTTKSRCSY